MPQKSSTSSIVNSAIQLLLDTDGLPPRVKDRLRIALYNGRKLSDQHIAKELQLSRSTVSKWRRIFAKDGLAPLLVATDKSDSEEALEVSLPPQTAKSTDLPPRLSEIAEQAGVSTATVSLALRDNRRISPKRRQQIQKIAEQLGYRRNPLLSAYQAQIRSRKRSKYLGTLGWLIDTPFDPGLWKHPYNRPFLDGAKAEAARLGYQIDAITLLSEEDLDINGQAREQYLRRLNGILTARGINGLILPRIHYSSLGASAIDGIAIVHMGSIEGRIAQLRRHGQLDFPIEASYHEVYPNYFENFRITWEKLTALGYTKIGTVLHTYANENSNQQYHACMTFSQDLAKDPDPIPLLSIENTPTPQDQTNFEKWLNRWHPEVIICQHNKMCEMLQKTGMRVPEEIGVVHLGVSSEIRNWSGIDERMEEIGSATVRTLVSQMQLNRYQPPNIPMRIAVDGKWRDGQTLKTTSLTTRQ